MSTVRHKCAKKILSQPSPWVRYFDEASNHFYFFNEETGESTWEPPTSASSSRQGARSEPAAAPFCSLAQRRGSPQPYNGVGYDAWVVRHTPDGIPYYYCETTGVSTWDDPRLPKPNVWRAVASTEAHPPRGEFGGYQSIPDLTAQAFGAPSAAYNRNSGFGEFTGAARQQRRRRFGDPRGLSPHGEPWGQHLLGRRMRQGYVRVVLAGRQEETHLSWSGSSPYFL